MIRIATLLSGHGLASLATLARNLLLARMLGPEEYGIVVLVIIMVAAAEMLTTMGLPQFMVSQRVFATNSSMANLHLLQIGRGLLGAVLILLCATPVAQILEAPRATSLLCSTALVPLILSFTHLDPYRMQRHQIHAPCIIIQCLPALITLFAAWPISKLSQDPNAIVVLLVTQAFTTVLISHLLAKKTYQVQFSATKSLPMVKYGLPLAANGMLMFFVFHAEKLISGIHLGLFEMGQLAFGLSLTVTPCLIAARSFQAYHLPRLRLFGGSIFDTSLLIGASLAVLLATVTPWMVSFVGNGFGKTSSLVSLMILLAVVRLPKSAIITGALAKGETRLSLLLNFPRLVSAPVVWLSLSNGGTIETLLVIAIGAEVIGLVIALYFARQPMPSPLQVIIYSLMLGLALTENHSLAWVMFLGAWTYYLYPKTVKSHSLST